MREIRQYRIQGTDIAEHLGLDAALAGNCQNRCEDIATIMDEAEVHRIPHVAVLVRIETGCLRRAVEAVIRSEGGPKDVLMPRDDHAVAVAVEALNKGSAVLELESSP